MTGVPLAVIGLGFMGSRWARALSEHPAADIAVVSDIREDVGRQAADRLAARYVPDALAAASDAGVAGVVVATPEHLHVAPALAAIEAGKAVIVEKPIAHTLEDAERIRDHAHHRHVPVLVGHVLRFEPRYAAARRAVADGEVGEVQAVRHERIGLVADQDVLQGRTTIPLYYGVHEFDLARWYAGDVERVYAERSEGVLRESGYEIDDLYSAVLRFASGAHGTVMLGWSLPRSTPGYGIGGVTIIGDRGFVRIAQGDIGLVAVGEQGLQDIDAYYAPEVHGRLRGALAIEVDHFIDVARGVTEPICTAHDGTEAVRISLAMEESARRRSPLDVPHAVR